MTKKFTEEQLECINKFEAISGFECSMYQDEFEKGEMTFFEFWQANVSWLEDVVAEVSNIKIPLED